MIAIYLIVGLVAIRGIETYRFIKSISKLCYKYDWALINDGNELLLLDMADKDYMETKEWSAYNFLFLKGPSPLGMFLSFKSMNIETQYNKEVVDRIKKYEII
jgi:hypothetical protein